MRVRPWLDRFSRSHFLILGIFVLLGGFFVWSTWDPATPTDFAERSSEYAFFNTSPLGETGGLAVPASCPSDLHDQPNYGQACSACNSQGACNSGSIQCGGSCSASAPPVVCDNSCANSTCVGQSCANSCGQWISGTNPGSWSTVSGNCTALGYTGGTYTYQVNSCTGAQQNFNTSGCTSCVGNQGQSCSSPPNSCGQTNGGTIQCSGACSAGGPPPNPPGYGNGCQSSPNSCGMTNWGTIQCGGNCSAGPPPDSACPPICTPCTSAPNACGQTNSGSNCGSGCSASTPSNPAGYGSSCQSAPNSCGMTNWGTIDCSGNCNASTPSNAACATCPNGSCGGGESCFSCAADCGSAPGTGSSCNSAPNSCGMTNGGTILCDGSCSAGGPPGDWLCPPVSVCGNSITEPGEQCDTGGGRGSCPAACDWSCNWNSCGGGGTDGQCGWANGGSYSSQPSGGLCNTGGSSSPFSGGGYWNWTCSGSGGGNDASCWAFDTSGGGGGGGGFCGDGSCGSGENCGNCSADCGSCGGFCGDGSCGGGETCGSCPGDCGSCTPPPACDWTHYNCASGSSSGGFDGGASWFWWCTAPGYGDAFCSEPKPAPSGTISVSGCTIPVGGSSCTSTVTWSSSNAANVAVGINTSPQTNFNGAAGNNFPFTVGVGNYTATLTENGNYLASSGFSVSCAGGSEWDSLLGSCQIPPSVDLKINGLDDVTTELGENLIMSWSTSNTNASTTCTASGVGWSGPKNRNGGTDPIILASITTDYVLTCTKGGLTGSDSVHVEIFCEYTESTWTACEPPCTGGLGTQTQTITFNSCLTTNVSRSCTTTTCRDINWKEIGQQD